MKKHFLLSGFTFIEISIVLVVIALIIGGIIAGKDLVQTSRLNKVMSDFQNYESADIMFYKKYHQTPGDFVSAVAVLGASANGNGDGIIESNEVYMFWQHLGLAGFIPQAFYSGHNSNGDTNAPTVGTDIPAGPITHSDYMVIDWWLMLGGMNATTFGTAYDFPVGGGATMALGGIITPAQAYFIDTKLDEGDPTKGRIFVMGNATFADCSDGIGKYVLTTTYAACSIVYRMHMEVVTDQTGE